MTLESRRAVMQLLRNSSDDVSEKTVQLLEHRLTSRYYLNPEIYQRNTQIVARHVAIHGDAILSSGVLEQIDTAPCELSLNIMLENRDQRARDAYHRSIVEFKELVENEKSLLQCRRCGNHTVLWAQQQTRAGDEGATTFCKCLNPKCLATWVC